MKNNTSKTTKAVLTTSIAALVALTGVTVFDMLAIHQTSKNVQEELNYITDVKQKTSEKLPVFEIVGYPKSMPRAGGVVRFELYPGKVITGTINVVQERRLGSDLDSVQLVRFGGDFADDFAGTFAFAIEDGVVQGMVQIPTFNAYYELEPTLLTGSITFKKKDVNSVVCNTHPGDEELQPQGTVTSGTVQVTSTTTSAVPVLNSRPDAKVHLYLDFDGETVQDPLWNGGKVIVAKPSGYRNDQIQEVWRIVSERYAAFNLNVTTDVTVYNNAGINNRTRIILTPSNEWKRGYGGIAYIGSLRYAGKGVYSANIPGWVFTNMLSRLKSAGEAVAHELGHTLGLGHDGTSTVAYYAGQSNWAPIMGVSYNANIVQFSKGEYANANNKQDDIAIVAQNTDVGFPIRSTVPKYLDASNINVMDVISNQNDIHTYRIEVAGNRVLNITASIVMYGALDIKLQVKNATTGVVVSTSDTSNCLGTTLKTPLAKGAYLITVEGASEGNGITTGYTKYGSIGTYRLLGQAEYVTAPVATSVQVAGALRSK